MAKNISTAEEIRAVTASVSKHIAPALTNVGAKSKKTSGKNVIDALSRLSDSVHVVSVTKDTEEAQREDEEESEVSSDGGSDDAVATLPAYSGPNNIPNVTAASPGVTMTGKLIYSSRHIFFSIII